MKPLIKAIGIVLVLFSFAACDQLAGTPPPTPAELIVGKWQFEKLVLPEADLDRLETEERAQFDQMQLELKMMRYSFFDDGTYTMDIELGEGSTENIERGNYRLIDDGAVLVTEHTEEITNQTRTTQMSVLRLSADTLFLTEREDQGSLLYLRSK